MIIDARCRPPVDYFLDQVMYRNSDRSQANVRSRGFTPSHPLGSRSMTDFWAEVDDASIDTIVVPGRLPNEMFGGAEDVTSLYEHLGGNDRAIILESVSAVDADPGARIKEARARGARGLVFEPGLDPGYYLDDAQNSAFYDAASQSGLPIYIMGGGNAGPDVSFANPVALDRVAARFPELRLIAVHAGWPWIQETLGVAFRRSNVWLLPDLYFPGMPGEADILIAAKGYLQDRLLFASAYPFCNLPELVNRYRQLPLPGDILDKLFGKNAERLFGL